MPSGFRRPAAHRPAQTTTRGDWISPAPVLPPVTRLLAIKIASTDTYWTIVAPSSRARVANALVVIAASAYPDSDSHAPSATSSTAMAGTRACTSAGDSGTTLAPSVRA